MPRIIVVSPSAPADGWLHVAITALERQGNREIRRHDGAENDSTPAAFAPDAVWIDSASPLETVPAVLEGTLGARHPLLLTRGATSLPFLLGLEESPPILRDPTGFHGHCSFRGHPVFDGLGLSPATATGASGSLFVPASRPPRARVLALARFGDFIDPAAITIRSYDRDTGGGSWTGPRILCIGGGIDVDASDAGVAARALRMIDNAIVHIGRTDGDDASGTAWPRPGATAHADIGIELPASTPAEQSLPIEAYAPFIEVTRAVRLLAGRRAGALVGPAIELFAPPLRIARDLRIESIDRDDHVTRVSALGIERSRRQAGTTIAERIAIPRDLAAAFIEWEADAPVRIDVAWEVDLRLDALPAGAGGNLGWNRGDGVLAVRSDAGDRALFSLSDADIVLRAEEMSSGGAPAVRCGFSTDLSPGRPLRLTAWAAHAGIDATTPPPTLRNAAGLIRARAGTLRRMERAQLTLATPEPAIDAAFARARAAVGDALAFFPRLGRALVAPQPASPAHGGPPGFWMGSSFRTALASLALGDFDAVRDTLALAGSLQDIDGALPAFCTASGIARHDGDRATALYLMLLARYAAWSGDLGFVGAEWKRVEPAIAFCAHRSTRASAAPMDDASASLRATALTELAVAAESMGEKLAVTNQPIVRFATRATAAPLVVGADDQAPASRLITAIAHGLLGIDPDASRHRLRLRIRLPDSWQTLAVGGLRMGEAAVGLSYRRNGGRHVLRLEQTLGAAPIRLVLEPLLTADAVRSATVDGTPAELDPRVHESRLLVPVQIVLDHAREVVVEV